MEDQTIQAWVLFDPYYNEIHPLRIFYYKNLALKEARTIEKDKRLYRTVREIEIKFKE